VKNGFHLARPNFGHGLVKKTGKLLVPRILGSALYQINVFVDTILASFEGIVGAGGQSALYYSNRLFQLPLAIVGISIAQAVLPTFSTQIVREDLKGFKETFSMAVRSVLFVILPASAGLVLLCEPIVRIIFERGEFNAYSTQITSSALFFYAFGLLSCCLIKLLANAFYAMHDTRTPVKTALFSVALNIVLCLILMRPLQIGGLTLASSLSATVNVILLYRILRKRVGPVEEQRILTSFYRTLAAASVMGVFCYFYGVWFLGADASASSLRQATVLLGGILAAVIIYFVSAVLLRSEEARKILQFRSHGHS
ncbi:MAG TPA: murein biosynthesis integral membrane protein MurJ, partial [Candidatus Omnitrophota bacterium]|nr:murein biosynthesis integral membrane protein MurJ [Candidatus Omnitrophota bacterium]